MTTATIAVRYLLSRATTPGATLSGLLLLAASWAGASTTGQPSEQAQASGWVANGGQWQAQVAYRLKTAQGASFLLHSGELVHQLADTRLVREQLINARIDRARGAAPTSTRVSYFLGADTKRWQRDLVTYERLHIPAAYPGIDIDLHLRAGALERTITLHPGADVAAVRFHSDGATPRLDSTGRVELAQSAAQSVALSAPVAWQLGASGRESVAVAWQIHPDGSYGFELGAHDPARTTVIDPILQATYVGGTGDDTGASFLHPNGDIYLVGTSASTDLPATAGSAQPASNSNPPFSENDTFIARVPQGLTSITRITYLGGTGNEVNPEAEIASNGDLIIAGSTTSPDFPGTTGGAQPAQAGTNFAEDVYIARISADLTTLVQATYYGGSSAEFGDQLMMDTDGDLYVLGQTLSDDLPNTTGGAQATRGDVFTGAASEGFIVKLSDDLTSISQATYYGGSGFEFVSSILLFGNSVYVAGSGDSTDLPGVAGGAQATPGGSFDAFVVALNSDLTAVTQASYFGGSEFESTARIQAIGGNLYLSGLTQSPDLPNTTGGAQPAYGGGTPELEVADGFIALFNPGLTAISQATYFGGDGIEAVLLARTNSNNNLILSGTTNSTNLPGTTGAAQPDYAGGTFIGDAFVALLSSNLQTLVRTTYFGGSGEDAGFAMLAPSGELYAAGITNSPDLPGVTGGLQETFGGSGPDGTGDLFIARLTADLSGISQATYFGGSGDDSGSPLFLTSGTSMYIIGDTDSPNLAGTTGGAQPAHANPSSDDMFLALVSANLQGGSVPPPPPPATGPIFAAALPGQRVFTLGGVGATFFGTIINTGADTAVDCSIAMATALPANFSYQTTDAANALAGTANTPADIPAGGAQSFLFSIAPTATFPSTEVQLNFDCLNTDPVTPISGVNTVNVLSTSTPTPDVVAIALTATGDGIAHIPGPTGSVAFAMATVNVGAAGAITLGTDTGAVDLGITVALCQTNPADGSCLAPPSSSVDLTMATNATPTFSFFVTGSQNVPLDPAVNRLNLRFFIGGLGGTQVGQSSVALWTNPAN